LKAHRTKPSISGIQLTWPPPTGKVKVVWQLMMEDSRSLLTQAEISEKFGEEECFFVRSTQPTDP